MADDFHLGVMAALDVLAYHDEPTLMDDIAETVDCAKLAEVIEKEGLDRTRKWWAGCPHNIAVRDPDSEVE